MAEDKSWGDETSRDTGAGVDGACEPQGDFRQIKDAVMETARGRWFLDEYARRIRSGSTSRILDAISRLETVMVGQARLMGAEGRENETFASVKNIGEAEFQPQAEMVVLRTPAAGETGALPQPDDAQDHVDVAAVQEKLLDIVWYMRERGFDGRLCSAISQEANKLTRFSTPAGDGSKETPAPVEEAECQAGALSGGANAHQQVSAPAPESEMPESPQPDLQKVDQCRPEAASITLFSAVESLNARKKLEFFY